MNYNKVLKYLQMCLETNSKELDEKERNELCAVISQVKADRAKKIPDYLSKNANYSEVHSEMLNVTFVVQNTKAHGFVHIGDYPGPPVKDTSNKHIHCYRNKQEDAKNEM